MTKERILNVLNGQTSSIPSSHLVFYFKGNDSNYYQNLTSKRLGSICRELVGEGSVIKELKNFPKNNTGFYMLTSVWLEKQVEWIKSKLPDIHPLYGLNFPVIEILGKDNVLEGKTHLSKIGNKINVTVTIYVSKGLLLRNNIDKAMKMILVHEFCHIINLQNPNLIMQKHFPEIYSVWQKAEKEKGLECSVSVKTFE